MYLKKTRSQHLPWCGFGIPPSQCTNHGDWLIFDVPQGIRHSPQDDANKSPRLVGKVEEKKTLKPCLLSLFEDFQQESE